MIRSVPARWWLSGFLASFGDGLRLAAFPLLAAQMTSSATAIGLVVALQGLPWLAIGPFAGVVVDRQGPRRVLLVVQSLQAAAVLGLAGLVVAHLDSLWFIGAAALITGVAATLRGTATQAATPRLTDHSDLDRVNGRLAAGSLIGSELLGPASAGLLFGLAAALPVAVNGGAIGLAIALVFTIAGLGPLPTSNHPNRATASAEVREGLGWVWHDRQVRTLVLAVGVVALADAAWFAVLVLYVTRVLHHSSGDYGLFLAFGAFGGIAASVACGRLAVWLDARRLFALSVVAMAGSQLVLGVTTSVVLASVMLVISSGAFAIFNVVAVGIRQRKVPQPLFGRVTSIYLAVGGGAEALGAILGGLLASTFGVRAPMLLGVIPLLVVAAALSRTTTRSQTV
jgi:MFS family permease